MALGLWSLRVAPAVGSASLGAGPAASALAARPEPSAITKSALRPAAATAADAVSDAAVAPSAAAPTLADVLAEAGDLSVPENRRRAVERMRLIERERRAVATVEARRRGLPLRVERPDGTIQELVAFENGRPVYFTTHNVNAALSSGAQALQASPYGLTGAGVTVGVWDGGSARASHREFATGSASRITVKDGAASIDHATHVSGTIAATGVDSSAKGMAPAALVDSYDWNSDKTEMTARAATAPNQPGMLYLSNHSYGYIAGWNYLGGAGSPARLWEWNGDGTGATAADYDFGRYNTYARDSDALAVSAPYYLQVRSAGNDRIDNPSAGQAVALSPGGATVVGYDPTLHPKGDGSYLGGYGTISFDALAKNILTVGSVGDAVSGGARSLSGAYMSSYADWGPTDDGRIKPDLVANGEGLYSSLNGGDASYGVYSGTSMASPSATGTAALLIEDYARLFPGGAMRSSTLKGLLIHTADDLGNPGPDYRHGWGLINAQAADDLLRDHLASPLKRRLTEGVINTANLGVSFDVVWDGVGPLRATLCWTDPAGTATTTNDLRGARLVNNLDLRVVGPGGVVYSPYVMPFVGAWTQASADLPATTGQNNTDNVEQVYVAAPPAPGVYRVTVSLTGTLSGAEQRYSLLLSGAANETPPPPALRLDGVAPATSLPGAANITLTGAGFQSGVDLRLRHPGSADIVATNVQFGSSTLSGLFNLAGAAAGAWDLVATNTNGETATLAAAFTIQSAIWCETFDGAVGGWTSSAMTGGNAWVLSTAQSQSPSTSYFAPGPSSKTTTGLVSPVIAIPPGANNLQFRFWHRHEFANTSDAGRLDVSADGGATWLDVTDSGSGAAFASYGYNGTVGANGPTGGRNEFAGKSAWVGSSGAFLETVVNLTDTARFAGKNFRARWRIATNSSTASTGWYVDSVALTGGGNLTNAAPVIVSPVVSGSTQTTTDPDGTVHTVIAGRETTLAVTASDDGGEENLAYAWSASSSGGAPVSFAVNGSNAAKANSATFEAVGDYLVSVEVRDAEGLAATSSLRLRVVAVADGLSVSPPVASVTVGGQIAFSAVLLDQFGQALATQPASVAWNAAGGGSIDGAGVYAATTAGGPYGISAAGGGFTATATVSVNRAAATLVLDGLSRIYDGEPKPVSVTTIPAGLAVAVTYDGGLAAPSAVGGHAVSATVVDPNYQASASGTLLIRTGYAAWAEARGLSGVDAAETADPDEDGLPNLLEYAVGADPLAAGPSPIGASVVDGRLGIRFPRVADPGLVYTVEASDDLVAWSTLSVLGNPSTGAANAEGPALLLDSREPPAASRRFLRLKVAY